MAVSSSKAMAQPAEKTILDVSRELGCYSVDAFEFLHRGLDFTVRRVHGPPAAGLSELIEWLHGAGCEPNQLEGLLASGKAPEPIVAFIEQLGGLPAVAKLLNRHIGGEELCWGLRDLSLEQWGLMAATVLEHWGIRSTKDFGRMVFALVENGLLQKQPDDCVRDFDDVYDFGDALGKAYKVTLKSRPSSPAEKE